MGNARKIKESNKNDRVEEDKRHLSQNSFIDRSNHNSVHTGSVELKPDKPSKNGERWNKASGSLEIGTADEAGTTDASARGGCQNAQEF